MAIGCMSIWRRSFPTCDAMPLFLCTSRRRIAYTSHLWPAAWSGFLRRSWSTVFPLDYHTGRINAVVYRDTQPLAISVHVIADRYASFTAGFDRSPNAPLIFAVFVRQVMYQHPVVRGVIDAEFIQDFDAGCCVLCVLSAHAFLFTVNLCARRRLICVLSDLARYTLAMA